MNLCSARSGLTCVGQRLAGKESKVQLWASAAAATVRILIYTNGSFMTFCLQQAGFSHMSLMKCITLLHRGENGSMNVGAFERN